MRIGLVNASSLVKDADVLTIAAAITRQFVEDFCPAWRIEPTSCLFVPGSENYVRSPDVLALVLKDKSSVDGALGFHYEENDGTIDGEIGVSNILDAGGGILTQGRNGDSVSSVCSHEALEAKKDPNCNLWVDGPFAANDELYASGSFEMCDWCQANGYLKNDVLVSDFILPAWLDERNSTGPYSFTGSIKAPLSLAPGGYGIVRNAPGTEQDIFSEGETTNAMPWRKGLRRWMRRR